MKVHPAADIFPMVPDDGLQSLAESIKTNGLRFPIVVREVPNDDGELEREIIDGRNRLRACEIARVEPAFTLFEGDETAVRAFIADVNLERRDLKKGQKAMALAMLFPNGARGRGNHDEARKSAETASFSYRRVQEARQIIAHSAALAEDVIADRVPLDKALEQVKREQQQSMGNDARLARLRSEAPDFADLVDDERMSLSEACAANEKRQEERAHRLKQAEDAAAGLWRDISNKLGIIAHGRELGKRYVLPLDEREMAGHVLRELTEMFNGKG